MSDESTNKALAMLGRFSASMGTPLESGQYAVPVPLTAEEWRKAGVTFEETCTGCHGHCSSEEECRRIRRDMGGEVQL